MTSAALGAILLFAVLAFGATERWALAIFQIAVFVLAACRMMVRPVIPRPAWPLVGIVAWGLIQLGAGWTVYPFATSNALLSWGAWLALYAIAAGAAPSLRGMIYAGALIAVVALLQHFTSPGVIYWLFPTRSGRSFGPFVNPDHFAALMELLIPLAVWQAFHDRSRALLHAGIAALLYASVVATGSRAGIALATVEIFVLPLFIGRVRLAMQVGSLALAATLVVGWELAWQRFWLSDPFRFRREIAQSTLDMIRERPWTGFGLGTYETVYPAYARFDNGLRVDHAHNDWLEWTTEGGLPMLVLLAAFTIVHLRRARAPWSWGGFVVLVHSLVDFPMQIPGLAAPTIALLAALPDREPGRETDLSRCAWDETPAISARVLSRSKTRAFFHKIEFHLHP